MLPISRYYIGIIFIILLSACGEENSGFPKSECGGDINPCASYPVSLEVTPETIKSPTGIVIQYLATVTLSDGEQQDVTNNSSWQINNTAVASINNVGMLTTLSAGSATVTAIYSAVNGISVSDEAELTVNDIDLIGLEVTPSKHETLIGLTVNYQAWAKYQTGELVNVTSSSSWSFSKPSIAEIQTQGNSSQVILAKSAGLTDVSAQFKTFNSNGQLAVIDSPVNALVITPIDAVLPQGIEKQYQANLVLDNGQSIDVTLFTQWAIDNNQIGTFNNTYVFSANTAGITTIEASFTYDDIALTDVTEVTVVNAQAERLLIIPQDGQFPLGSQGQFEAFALYTNGDVLEVTNQTTWNFSDPIGTIETDGEQAGYATATAIGTTKVNANFNNLVTSTSAEVTAAQLVELILTPLNYSTPAGTQVVYQGFARFTDNSSHDITKLGGWSSSEQDIAKIGFRGATSGVSSTFLSGETQICVKYMSMQACTELTVTDAVANKLVVTPVNVKVPLGINGQFNATAYYTNGRSQDVTKLATWQSANVEVASVNPTGPNAGFTTSKSVGESTILASFEALTDQTTLTITDAELTELAISPVDASIPKGTKHAYTLTGIYSDGSYNDLTLSANWQTNNSDIAYFANASIASGTKEGTVAVTASINGLSVEAVLTVTEAELSYIAISPKLRTVPAGNFAQFNAIAYYTDSTNIDVSTQATWSSQNSTIASVVTSGSLGGQVSAISEGETFVTAYFNNQSDNATVTVSQAVLEQVVISPKLETIAAGIKQEFSLTAIFSNGKHELVTKLSDWQSSMTSIATIDSKGVATSHEQGGTSITGTYNGFSDRAELRVTDAIANKLVVTPVNTKMPLGSNRQFIATAYYTNGSSQEVTDLALWQSTNFGVSSINPTGVNAGFADSKSVGDTTIKASFGQLSDNTLLTITDAELIELVISPVVASIPKGTEQAYTLTGIYSDGSYDDLTLSANWQIDNSEIAYFSKKSIATGVREGSVSVSASINGLSVEAVLTVTAAELSYIAISPKLRTVPAGNFAQFNAIAYYTDSTNIDVSTQATWSSQNSTIASVVTSGSLGGQVSAISEGETFVTAYFNNQSDNATVTVSQAVLEQVVISPKLETIAAGIKQEFSLTAIFSNGKHELVTKLSDWQSSMTSIATIDSKGVATSHEQGGTSITGTYNGFSDRAELRVTDAIANKLVVTPVNTKMPLGSNRQFIATAYYTNGSSQEVTDLALWQSTNSGVSSINPTGVNAGFADSKSVGDTTIKASFGQLSDNTLLTITDAELIELVISPVVASIPKGTEQAYTLTGIYSDGSYDDLTLSANWQIDNSEIAYFSKKSIATGVREGSVSVSASINGLSVEAVLTVTAAELSYIAISPKLRTVPAGHFAQFNAIAYYTDSTNIDVSTQATWSSQNLTIASVVTSGGLGGQVSAISEGETFVTAYFNNQSDNTTVIVSQAVLEQVVISPKSQTIVAGEQQTFTLTAIFSNGKHEVVTKYTDWQSSEISVATIDSLGIATSYIQGTTQITGTYQGISDQADLIISEAVITRLQVTPTNSSVPSGTNGQFSATAFFSDGNSKEVTTQALWQSDNTNSVKVNANGVQAGLATAFDPGTAEVSASYKGKTASAEVIVSAAELVDIQITPLLFNTFLGDEVTYTAIGLYSNNDSLVITDFVSWRSSEPNVANFKTVNSKASPVVATYAEGQTIITASYLGKISNNANLTVTSALLERLVVYPSPQKIPVGTNAQFLAHAYFSDGNNDDVTDLANWRADDISIASHNGVGEFISLAKGNTTVVAEYKSLESTAELSVTEATLDTLTISPISSGLNVDESQAFQTFASFSDGNSYEVTLDSTWQVADAIASVDVNGLVTAQAVGETKVLASYQGETVQADLLIAEKEVVRIEIRPASVEVYVNDNTQLRAYAIHADLTDTDITELATWSSSAPFTANVVATGVKAGYITTYNLVATVDIKVELNGQQDSSTITVIQKPPTPTSLLIEPNNETMRTFEDLQLKAYVLFNNNTFFRDEVTETATWSLSNPDLAYVSKPGLIHALKRGELVVTARYAGFSKTANITIRDELAEYIEITPLQPEVPVDTVGRFTAMAFYPSGREEDVTTKTTWKSDDEDIVHIVSFSNDGGTATALKAGVTDITANFGGVIATTSVTVTDTELSTVYIDPDNFQLNVNEQQNLTAFAVFANGDEEEVTLDGDWLVADNTIASVNQTANTVNALGVNSGNTSITFSYQGQSATANVKVISAKLLSITIEPEDLSIAIDEDFNFIATGVYDNGDERDITTQITWSVKDAQLATIESSTGLFTGKSRGFTEVYAELQDKKATAYVNVSFYILNNTVIRPNMVNLTVGESKQLRCFNIYALADDEFVNYEEEITQTAAWVLGFSEEVATFSDPGLIKGTKVGTNAVECRYDVGSGTAAVGSADLIVTN